MADRNKLSENDLKAVNGGLELTDAQWKAFADKAAALAQSGALSVSDKAAMDLIIGRKDSATLLPFLLKKQSLGGAWTELMQVFLTF